MQFTPSVPTRFVSSRGWELLAVLGAALLGAGVVLAPIYVLVAGGAAFLLVLLARGPLTRTVIVMVSSLSLLQISAGQSVEKWSYLAILVVATGFGAMSLRLRWTRIQAIGGAQLLWPAALIAAVVALSAVLAAVHGIDLTSWAADVPAYGMLSAAVILGLDLAASDHKPQSVAVVLFLAAFGSALAFALQWTARHGVTNVDFGRVLFASMFLPGAALCLALAYAFDGRRTYLMAFLTTGLLFAMLITATRSAVVFLLPIVMTLLIARGQRRWRIAGLVVGAALAALILGTLLSVIGVGSYLDLQLLQSRLGGLLPLLFSGNPLADPSLNLRFLQTQALLQAWLGAPWFGVGPGAQYTYSNLTDTHPVDSPLAVFARFGVVGVAVFLVLFVTLLVCKLRRRAHWVPATALLTFVGLVLAWSLVSSPLDDKGVALGLIPLIGLCGVWRQDIHNHQHPNKPLVSRQPRDLANAVSKKPTRGLSTS